jgi:hypothetical protein
VCSLKTEGGNTADKKTMLFQRSREHSVSGENTWRGCLAQNKLNSIFPTLEFQFGKNVFPIWFADDHFRRRVNGYKND